MYFQEWKVDLQAVVMAAQEAVAGQIAAVRYDPIVEGGQEVVIDRPAVTCKMMNNLNMSKVKKISSKKTSNRLVDHTTYPTPPSNIQNFKFCMFLGRVAKALL